MRGRVGRFARPPLSLSPSLSPPPSVYVCLSLSLCPSLSLVASLFFSLHLPRFVSLFLPPSLSIHLTHTLSHTHVQEAGQREVERDVLLDQLTRLEAICAQHKGSYSASQVKMNE